MAALAVLPACESSPTLPWAQDANTAPTTTTAEAPAAPVPEPQAAAPEGPSERPPIPSLGTFSDLPDAAAPDAQLRTPLMPLVPPSDVPRVAMLLPLSGPQSGIGRSLLNSAQLALFDFAGDKFELVVHDTKGTEDGAAQAIALAIGDGASLVLGPLLATSVRAVTPAARAAAVPVVAFSSDRSVAGDGIFTMGFLPETGIVRVVHYARTRGITRFAAMVPDDAYGERVLGALRDVTDRSGANITNIQYYDPNTQDFAPAVRQLARYESRRQALLAQRAELEQRGGEVARRALERLESLETIGELPFEALLIADGGKRLQNIAAHLPFYDIDPARVRMLGTGQWDEPGVGAEPALIGGWFAAPEPQNRAGFEDRYTGVYGKKPPRLATLAYDATALAVVLAQGEGGPDFSLETLSASSGFAGRDGIFRFGADGAVERGLAVLEVQRQEFKVIDRAPETFGPAIF